MSPNVETGGVQNGSFVTDTYVLDPITISGADKLKVVLTYDIEESIDDDIGGIWWSPNYIDDYEDDSYEDSEWTHVHVSDDRGYGSTTFVVDGDAITATS